MNGGCEGGICAIFHNLTIIGVLLNTYNEGIRVC